MRFKAIIVFFFLIAIAVAAKAQIAKTVNLHTDRQQYFPGDKIAFKSYLITVADGRLSQGNEVIYFDFYTPQRKRLTQLKVLSSNGEAFGYLPIPADVDQPYLYLIAYTNEMRNYDTAFYLKKKIDLESHSKVPEEELSMQFFPEGGSLVADVLNKVIIKVSAGNVPVMTEGVVVDQYNNTVTSFRTNGYGYGTLYFKPSEEAEYKSLLKGNYKEYTLPPVISSGVSLQAENDKDNIRLYLRANEKFVEEGHKSLNITMSIYNEIYYSIDQKISSQPLVIDFPVKDMPAGVAKISVRNGQRLFLERFISVTSRSPGLLLATDRSQYVPREDLNIRLSAQNAEELTGASLSVSVYSEKYHFTDSAPIIENPFFYDQWLDNYLITSTANPLEIKPATYNEYYPKESFLQLKGRIKTHNNASVPDSTLVTFLIQEENVIFEGYTYNNGYFNFPIPLIFNGARKVMTHASYQGKSLSNYSVESSPVYISKEHEPDVSNRLGQLKFIEKSYNYYTGNTDNANYTSFDISQFYDRADVSVALKDYVSFPTMEMVVRELLPNVWHRTKKGINSIRIFSEEIGSTLDGDPLFIIDNEITFDNLLFLNLKPEEVKSIDVLSKQLTIGKFGSIGQGGIIVVTTHKGNFNSNKEGDDHQGREFLFAGFIPENTAYKSSSKSPRIPDFRLTSYWNPKIALDTQGQCLLKVELSDDLGSFIVEVRGVTQEGKIIYETIPFEVAVKPN